MDRFKRTIMQQYNILHIYEIFLSKKIIVSPPLGKNFIGIWTEREICYLFFNIKRDDIVNSWVSFHGDRAKFLSYQEISYEDWQGGSRIKSFEAGGFNFVPIWETHCNEDIIFDPSVVFGNGQHPTTRACLEIMICLMNKHPIQSVLDLGTGSGILSLAAARLGAHVLAIDLNLLAVEIARKNVSLNHLDEKIDVMHSDVLDYKNEVADIWLANLPNSVLLDLFHGMDKNNIPFKWAILSGIFHEQSWEISSAITDVGILVENILPSDSWVTMLLRS